jgi:hypothetical protein
MSEYELKRMRNITRNNARLASLGLLVPMTSATTLFSDRPSRKKRVVPQDDVERRVQPKRNAKKPTSYRDLDDHVIFERTQPIDSSDTVDEDTVHKRLREEEAEYSPSNNNDEEEYNEDKDELETPTAANAYRLHHYYRQYQSVEFYNAEKRLIDRYEDVSDGIKADISPDPLPLPQEMKKQKKNYENWFAGHYPSPLQDGESYTDKNGHATAFTTSMYENAVNSGLPPDKQLVFGQMFDYFTDCTLGQVPFLAGGENYCHEKHFLKGKLADDAAREHWRNLRIDVFSRLIIDAINRKSVGTRVLIIGVMPSIIFPSILKEARSMAIDHFKEQGIVVEFDLQFIISPHFCSVIHGLNQEDLAKMDNAVMQSQGNLLRGVNYFQTTDFTHLHRMSNVIDYIRSVYRNLGRDTRLMTLPQDGTPLHISMIEYFTRFRDDILQRAKLTCFEELTVFHLLSYMGKKGYENGLGSMSAEERMVASKKGYENGIGAMSAEEKKMRMGIVWEKKYAEFKRCIGMPERGTPLHNWQKYQLDNGNASLNAKIQKELAENKGSTIWRESGVKLANCVEQKNCAQMGIVWEEKYDEFESYDGMPERGTPLDTWQKSQLGNTHGSCLNAKIQKELAENKGSTIWRERRVKLANCVEQKRRA